MRHLVEAALHPRNYKWGLREWNRNSLVVLVAGLSYVAIGATYVGTSAEATRESALAPALLVMPLSSWGYVWIAVGILAMVSSRWPPASETWGYAALSGLASLWSGVYLFGVIDGASGQSISGFFVWALVAFLWWAIAGLIAPEDVASLVPPRRED